MNKNQLKAKKIVNNAVGTFSIAITEVQKANNLLSDAVKADEKMLVTIEDTIKNLYKQIDIIQSDKIEKESEINNNIELMKKLAEFTGGNK
jgi:hypothetical protein